MQIKGESRGERLRREKIEERGGRRDWILIGESGKERRQESHNFDRDQDFEASSYKVDIQVITAENKLQIQVSRRQSALSYVVALAATLRVAGAPEGYCFAAAGPWEWALQR